MRKEERRGERERGRKKEEVKWKREGERILFSLGLYHYLRPSKAGPRIADHISRTKRLALGFCLWALSGAASSSGCQDAALNWKSSHN